MFSPRPNTKASKMSNQIPKKVARSRFHKLLKKSLFNQWGEEKAGFKRA